MLAVDAAPGFVIQILNVYPAPAFTVVGEYILT